MSKVAHYLQEHLVGEILTNSEARRFFSTDGSIFTITPAIVVYPQNENDVRKVARFTWQLAERGRVIPITARGLGTDQSGAAIGSGVIMVFPAHMGRILEFDGKTGQVTVEPGINFGKLQQALYTHGRFIPAYPSSMEYSTVGGAIAKNAAGEKSVKYGDMRGFTKALRVILANGEVIETRRLSKRELSRKLGLATFEGEVYRALDTLIEENDQLIKEAGFATTKNAAGYELASVRGKDGSFDLTPLFTGSQGTLGIITEAVLDTAPYNPATTLIAAFCDDIHAASEVINELRGFADMPSAIEVVDDNLLNLLDKMNPNQLKGVVEKPYHKLTLLVEFDTANERVQKRMVKKATKLFDKYDITYQVETEQHKKEELWKIRHSAAAVFARSEGGSKALPVIEDGIVPVERFEEYLESTYAILDKYNLRDAVWGHAGDANLHLQPFLDLSQVGDRQKVFRIADEYYNMIINLGGSTSGEHNDGRLRGPYLPVLYGQDMYQVFQKVKEIFDPYHTLNPGVKIDVTVEDNKPLLRQEYSMSHLYNHLPRL